MPVVERVAGEAMGNSIQDRMMLFGVCLFIVLILCDLYQAYFRRAFWVPGNALILSGLTIQLLGFLQAQKVSIKDQHRSSKELLESEVSIDCSRVILCVFVGYMLPGMASPAHGGRWTNISALLVSICTQIATESYGTYDKNNVTPDRGWWFIASSTIMLLSVIVLVLLLGFAAIWGKHTSDSLSRKIRFIFNQNTNPGNEGNPLESWEKFQDEILKSWIFCRMCQPEYVLVRSIFSAAAGGTITVCVAILAAKIIFFRSVLNHMILISLQLLFIGIGWIVIFYRWFMAVLYFKDFRQSMLNSSSLLAIALNRCAQLLLIIVGVLRYDYPSFNTFLKSLSLLLQRLSGSKTYIKWITVIFIIPLVFFPLFFLCLCLVWVAYIVVLTAITPFLVTMGLCVLLIVSVSIFFWVLLPLICRNKYIRYLCKVETTMTSENEAALSKYKKFLEFIVLPGEDPASLWIANQSSYHKIKESMKRAAEGGKSRQQLIVALRRTSFQARNEFSKFIQIREMDTHNVPIMVEPAWRMTALSLVRVIMKLGELIPAADIENNCRVQFALRMYMQAVDLMDFVDSPKNVQATDIFGRSNMETVLLRYEANSLTEELETSFRLWLHGRSINTDVDNTATDVLADNRPDPVAYETVVKCFKDMYDPAIRNLQQLGFGSLGFMERVMPNYCLYQLCMFFQSRSYVNFNELQHCLVHLLAHIMDACLSQLPQLLVNSCRKWAAEFDEEKIFRAIEIAGKAWAVMEEARKLPAPIVQALQIQPPLPVPSDTVSIAVANAQPTQTQQNPLPTANVQPTEMHAPLPASNV